MVGKKKKKNDPPMTTSVACYRARPWKQKEVHKLRPRNPISVFKQVRGALFPFCLFLFHVSLRSRPFSLPCLVYMRRSSIPLSRVSVVGQRRRASKVGTHRTEELSIKRIRLLGQLHCSDALPFRYKNKERDKRVPKKSYEYQREDASKFTPGRRPTAISRASANRCGLLVFKLPCCQ